MVIDDIDRLSNEQIRQVFQLVTSVAKFPNTIYLLVFDKDIVVKALEKVQEGCGTDYLEKIIQMPIQIPDIKPTKLRRILLERLNNILSKCTEVGVQQSRWGSLFETCIAPFVDSLRTINRLCNTVQFKLSSIAAEVDFTDIAAISALEIQYPIVYQWIKDHKALLTGELDWSAAFEGEKTQKDWKDYYFSQMKALLYTSGYSITTDEQVEEIIVFLSHLFPHFGQKIGEIYQGYNLNLLRKNNQIAHPEKFDRYFDLELDEITIKKSEIVKAVFASTYESLVKTLLEKAEKGDAFEFLEEIRALSLDIPEERGKIIANALLTTSSYLDTPPRKNPLSLPASTLAEHVTIELLDRLDPSNRFQFISDMISNSDLSGLQALASIINMLELAYGRLDANGKERKYKKVIALDELTKIEPIFVGKIQEILKEYSLFDFKKWSVICHLLEYLAPDYTNAYLETALKEDSNIAQYLSNSVTAWTGAGIEYEITDDYKKYLTKERVLQAIESLKQSGTLFSLPENIQKRCCAFYINAIIEKENFHEYISETAADKLLISWKQH